MTATPTSNLVSDVIRSEYLVGDGDVNAVGAVLGLRDGNGGYVRDEAGEPRYLSKGERIEVAMINLALHVSSHISSPTNFSLPMPNSWY
jgi:hypothetical protein